MSSELKVVPGKNPEKNKQDDTPLVEDAVTVTDEPLAEALSNPEDDDHYMGGAYSSNIIKKLRKNPTAIGKLFKEGKYPYTDKIPRSSYEKEKAKLQIELLKVQNWVKLSGQKIVVIFEGRDAAGKGGTIKRFMEHLNPRAAKVVALEKPTEHELGQWYFSATWCTCPPGVKSCSWTDPGTTAPAWKG